jgi:hypothetical protein
MLDGSEEAASADGTIVFWVYNGVYAYTVTPPQGYTANPQAGTLLVNRAGVTVTVTFNAKTPENHFATYALAAALLVAFAAATLLYKKRKP